MKRFGFLSMSCILFFSTASLWASVYTPISLAFDITKSNPAFVALIALFFMQVIWLRLISGSHILKVLFVVPCMNVASVVITTWAPYFIFENIITGKFTRYMVYVNFKDFLASNTALLNGLLIVGVWVLINVAVEAMVVGLFYHTINKRSLFIMLVVTHVLGIGVALAPEVMKKLNVKEVTIERVAPKPLEQPKDEKKPKEKETVKDAQ